MLTSKHKGFLNGWTPLLKQHLQDHEEGHLPGASPDPTNLPIQTRVWVKKNEEIDKLKAVFSGAQDHIKELQTTIRTRECTLDDAVSRECVTAKRLAEAEFEVARLRGIVGTQEKSKDAAVSRAGAAGRRLSETEDKNIRLRESLCGVEAELKGCRLAKDKVVARLSSGESEYQELLAINTSLEANLIDCQIKKRKFQVNVFILRNELASCREELRNSRAVHEKTITQFSNFRKNISSRFWEMRPLTSINYPGE